MGVLNVTPDSFSDGGRFLDPAVAIAHGRQMFDAGASIVDVGGESSRPGARPVSVPEELDRVLPVVESLAKVGRVSIDTTKPEVAEAAIKAGATFVNDISGSLWPIAAAGGVGWVAMHKQGTPANMQREPRYDRVVDEVLDWCVRHGEQARAAGVPEVWIDPGIGFGKTTAHNLELLTDLRRFVATGFPVLVGVSRKRFLGEVTAFGGVNAEPADRLEASLAAATWSICEGVDMVRVHDVAPTVDAVRLVHDDVSARQLQRPVPHGVAS